MIIQKAAATELDIVTDLFLQLWPEHERDELRDEFAEYLADPDAAVMLAFMDDKPVGAAQCSLRRDYVEGTESSPVGYLEGIFVLPAYRRNGIARALLKGCVDWAAAKGCSEFASDCELTNTESLHFHLQMGFIEANRIICFTKKL